MTIAVSTESIYSGERRTEELAVDVNRALTYLDAHIEPSQQWVPGALMDLLLRDHSKYVQSIDAGLLASRKCLQSSSSALGDVAARFDASENDAVVMVRDLFRDLDESVSSNPITATTPRRGDDGALPSALLVAPQSVMSDPHFKVVWDVMNWPDYLSITYWVRRLMNAAVQLFRPGSFDGQDMFEFFAQKLGGDWDRVAIAGDAFGRLGEYYDGLSGAVSDASADVFRGWSEGEGAAMAGEYFAELVTALAAQCEVFAALDTKYTDAAWAAFGACKGLISAIDALVDAVIAEQMGVTSIAGAIGTFFSAGSLAPVAAASAVVAAVEAFSAAWGAMMTAVSATIAVGAGVGSATQKIEFIPLLEA